MATRMLCVAIDEDVWKELDRVKREERIPKWQITERAIRKEIEEMKGKEAGG